MFYVGEASSDERNVGIGAFRSASTDGLVGTAGAGIALAGKIRFRTGAMFCKGPWLDGARRKVTDRVPGSGATSFGAALSGEARSTWMGSSSEGAILE